MTTLNLEDRIRHDMDMKYRTKLDELEQKSVLLDRSLQVVEEMREKFSTYEQQQSEYNSLLMKYNQLLCSQATAGMNGTAQFRPPQLNQSSDLGNSFAAGYYNTNSTQCLMPPPEINNNSNSQPELQGIPMLQATNLPSYDKTQICLSTPLNFQITTEDGGDIGRNPSGRKSINLHRVADSSNYDLQKDCYRVLDNQIQSTLIALDQQTLENVATSACFHTRTTMDKENIDRYENENMRLKRMNDILQREITKKQIVSSRKHVNTSSASLRRTNQSTIRVVRSPPQISEVLVPSRTQPTINSVKSSGINVKRYTPSDGRYSARRNSYSTQNQQHPTNVSKRSSSPHLRV